MNIQSEINKAIEQLAYIRDNAPAPQNLHDNGTNNTQLAIAVKRGFKVDRESTIEKLKEELDELIEAPASDEFIVNHPVFGNKTIQDLAVPFFKNAPIETEFENQYNANFFETYFKDTEIGELGDIITTCMTRLQELGINVKNLIDVIAIYNSFRALNNI